MSAITVLICTHNRADLLERVLESLNAAKRPRIPVKILVAANACTDGTVARMETYRQRQIERGWLPLGVIEVTTPGKSHALNQAIPAIDTALTAFVDDDHRVDKDYLIAIEQAAETWPAAGLYCGRILPDWDGTEPTWVHDDGPYRIFPLPVPRYDLGDNPKVIVAKQGSIPGGGNLIVRREWLARVGPFATDFGPRGHNLDGAEDLEWVQRALQQGAAVQYAPAIIQFHYVDNERLRLIYLLRKGYQRTRSTARMDGSGHVPLYMWRKLAEYAFLSLFCLSWDRRRFYWIRTAAALGEFHGLRESSHRGKGLDLPPDRGMLAIGALALTTVACGGIAWYASGESRWTALLPALAVAGIGSIVLLAKSLGDYSQTGPRIDKALLPNYRYHSIFAMTRLSLCAFVLMLFTSGGGLLIYYTLTVAVGWSWSPWLALAFATLGLLLTTAFQFINKLRFNPGLLVASMHYRVSRMYPMWQCATPERIRWTQVLLGLAATLLVTAASLQLGRQSQNAELLTLWATVAFYAGSIAWAGWTPEPHAIRAATPSRDAHPNILLIGSDTLRADRLGALGYHRAITPNIDALAIKGTLFANCYVPCARTAPSLVSMLTGTWPHTHGVRDNLVANTETRLKVTTLPQLLKPLGYRSAALSDWCGTDMGKFSFGFDHTDLPGDHWNLKYLIRQGPKDLRLFVSLFAHNRLGRMLLPELYFLGGVPLTTEIGCRARGLVSRLAAGPAPFFLNVFYSTTHPPFASQWPWYAKFGDPAYVGESKFAMAKLTDPFEIIRRQGAPKEEFDMDQIIDLYDGCVAQFDDQVGLMLRHLESCGLTGNTIVAVYSDHGMEFFEHDTWGQGNSAIGDFSARIPLLIHDPRKPGHGNVDQVIRSIDLAPTLLELAGAAPAPSMEGVSLAKCMAEHECCPELDAFNETGIWITDIPGLPDTHLRYPDLLELIEVPDSSNGTLAIKAKYVDKILGAKDRMVRRGRWKLVYQPLESGLLLRLFDLDADPECRLDVLDRFPDIVAQLRHALLSWIAKS